MILKKSVIITVVIVALASYIAYEAYMYNFHPKMGQKFMLPCDWKDLIIGNCDIEYKLKKDHASMTKDELDWVMKYDKVSKEEIIKYAKEYIEYRRGQIKKYDIEKGEIIPEAYLRQIERLENIIKILEE